MTYQKQSESLIIRGSTPLIRPSATFSHFAGEGRSLFRRQHAFSRREKVPRSGG